MYYHLIKEQFLFIKNADLFIKDHLFIDDRYQDLEWYAICKK